MSTIYEVKVKGRSKRILMAADSKHEAVTSVVTAKALNAAETTEALLNGEALWNPAEPLPKDDEPEEEQPTNLQDSAGSTAG